MRISFTLISVTQCQGWFGTALEGVKAEEIQTSVLRVTSLGTLELGERVNKPFTMSVFDKPIDRDAFLENIRVLQ